MSKEIEGFFFEHETSLLSLSVVLDNIDTGVAIYDAKGNFVFINTVMVNWRNIPRNEYLTMNIHDFSNYLDICVFDLVMEKKQRVSRLQFYRDIQLISGPERMRIVTGTPIFDGKGNVQYVITMLQDVQKFQNLYHTLLQEREILPAMQLGPDSDSVPQQQVVAKSEAMKNLISTATQIAPLDSSVLLYGESGSGKEVFARLIHQHSKRKDRPMVTVNCTALPENLIESELFGYQKGSFTGANKEGKIGLIEAADKGTLFIDEINSLPLSIQSKLLRVIEEKSIQRIGAVAPKKVDFRLIAATNQDLHALVREGKFREDLYYRLHVIPLMIPPIRNRKEDIVPLCLYFLNFFCGKYNLKKSFSQRVLAQVQAYDWPGNVREIRNFVERIVVMTPYSVTEIDSIPEGMLEEDSRPVSPREAALFQARKTTKMPTREELLAALKLFGNNRSKAAQYLGISRRSLQYKLKEYHIPPRYEQQ